MEFLTRLGCCCCADKRNSQPEWGLPDPAGRKAHGNTVYARKYSTIFHGESSFANERELPLQILQIPSTQSCPRREGVVCAEASLHLVRRKLCEKRVPDGRRCCGKSVADARRQTQRRPTLMASQVENVRAVENRHLDELVAHMREFRACSIEVTKLVIVGQICSTKLNRASAQLVAFRNSCDETTFFKLPAEIRRCRFRR